MQPDYVKDRLKSLDEIDLKLCAMLQEASQVVHSFSEVKSGNKEVKPQFEKHVKGFYTDLEDATIRLRNEIKLLDDNIGTRLLPINVNKKALGQDDEKLQEQIGLLRDILSEKKQEGGDFPAALHTSAYKSTESEFEMADDDRKSAAIEDPDVHADIQMEYVN